MERGKGDTAAVSNSLELGTAVAGTVIYTGEAKTREDGRSPKDD